MATEWYLETLKPVSSNESQNHQEWTKKRNDLQEECILVESGCGIAQNRQ